MDFMKETESNNRNNNSHHWETYNGFEKIQFFIFLGMNIAVAGSLFVLDNAEFSNFGGKVVIAFILLGSMGLFTIAPIYRMQNNHETAEKIVSFAMSSVAFIIIAYLIWG